MIDRRFVAVALAPFTLAACAASAPAASPSGAPSWSYEDAAKWGELDPSFVACGRGMTQSPIDLPTHATQSKVKPPALHWDPIPVRVTNDGRSVGIDDAAPSSLVYDGATYTLKSVHFHSPAEHTIDGRALDAEMQLVHKTADGKVLVVALLFKRGNENPALRAVWDAIPSSARSEPVDTGKTFDVQSLMPKSPRYWRYDGSFTAPPCTEGVTWLVVAPEPDQATSQMSEAQIGRLRAALHGPTNRPTQPLDGRVIVQLGP